VPTVLVVDDEPLVRKMVALMLEKDGFSVLTAGNGPDAIHLSRSHRGRIDLLVSDVRMPAMDGCTLASELQAENPTLPVLLISGYCENEPAEHRRRFPILPKPFSVSSLLLLVRGLLNKPVRASGTGSLQLTSADTGRGREET
jgi:two-component system, cell cycle sensor histidine kinase and response regulator CckA